MGKLYNKLLGSLVGAAAGDAMGAATELRTRRQIKEKFGYVDSFITPPSDTFARGNKAGEITDDFSVSYMTCQEIIKNKGEITAEIATRALLDWSKVDKYFTRFAGPTTRAAISALNGVIITIPENFTPINDNPKATNGGAMKAAPIALFSGGDIDKAIDDVIEVAKVTHDNNIALSGAAAVAAATAAAMKDGSTIYDIINAGLYGAKKGDEIGKRDFKLLAGSSIAKRIELAVFLAMSSKDTDEAITKIDQYIGSGLMATEAVPAAFGIIAASKGDAKIGIEMAVNIGNDTDTVATMVGGILGAFAGADKLPGFYIETLERENDVDLKGMARDMEEII